MEQTICQMYGHCYCNNKQVAGKAHQVCCKCQNTNMAANLFVNSLKRQRAIEDYYPGHFTKIFD